MYINGYINKHIYIYIHILFSSIHKLYTCLKSAKTSDVWHVEAAKDGVARAKEKAFICNKSGPWSVEITAVASLQLLPMD